VKKVGLWSETDFGYLAAYAAHDVLAGTLTNKPGATFKAGHLGSRTVIAGHTVILSKPIVFTKATIDKYHF
jgi:rhamnose transport system substrate-binding protein